MAAPHLCCGRFSPWWCNYVPSDFRCCSADEGTCQRQNMAKIPKSQTNQACVRHDGAVAGTKVLLPAPRGGQGSPGACLGARFQSGGRGWVPRGPRAQVKYEQEQRETQRCCCCCGARPASLSGSLAVNPVRHHLRLMTPCFTSPQTLIINI